jgi:hypothetical protein
MTGSFKARPKDLGCYFLRLLLIQVCIMLVLVPYSTFLGWNGLTLFGFWFIILPVLSIYLSSRFLGKKTGVLHAMAVLVFFYSFMVFMIYKHFQTDFFAVMMISMFWNLLIMTFVWLTEADDKVSTR